MKGGLAGKVEILLSARYQLGDDEIVDLETPARRPTSIGIPDWNETISPPLGKGSRGFPDTVGIVAEGLMEGRQLTDRPVYEIGKFRLVLWKEVGLVGNKESRRRVRELPKHGLTADDDELVVVGDLRRGADDVLELLAGQRS